MNKDVINEHYYGDPSEPTTERARERIHWICNQAKGRDILDVGCSQGIVCLILGREGFHCTGIDIESDSLAVAEQALAREDEIVRKRVTLKVADATDLPFPDESFDTVILGEILEHLVHPHRVLEQAKRVLRNEGRLVVTVPYGLNAFPDHKCTYYPISLLELLQPLCKTSSIETLGNYITYTGIKDKSYNPAGLTKESLFEQYLPLEKALEERCLSKEKSLLETATKLYAQIRNLTAQSEEKDRKLTAAQESFNAKDGQSRDLETQLDQARHTIAEQREQTARAQSEFEAQRPRINDLQEAVTSKDNRIRELEVLLGEKTAAVQSLNERLTEAESALKSQANKLEEGRQNLVVKEHRINQLGMDLERERASHTALNERVTRAEAAVAAQTSAAGAAQEALAAKASRIKELESELTRERASAVAIGERVSQAEASAMAQANSLKDIQDALRIRETRIKELETELEKARVLILNHTERTIRLEVESTSQKNRAKELGKSVASKSRQIGNLERSIQKERKAAEALGKELAQANSERTRLNGELEKLAQTLKAVEQKCAALQSETARHQQELAAKTASGQQQLARIEALHLTRLQERDKQHEALLAKREADLKRKVVNQRVREVARLVLPPEARVLVISKGDDDLLNLDGRYGLHFPQTAGGVYAGYHPADAAQAIAHLESLKAKGAQFLLIPASAFWWLDFYRDFRAHLEAQYRLLAYNEDCLIFALTLAPQNSRPVGLTSAGAPAASAKSAAETHSNGHTPAGSAAPTAQSASCAPPARTITPAPAVEAKPVTAPPAQAPPEAPQRSRSSTSLPETNRVESVVSTVVHADTRIKRPPAKLRVGCVFDEFTAACFQPECDLVTFRPDNWKAVLERNPIDLLFVESAWHGNGGSWQYKIASYKKPMGEELVDLVNYCRERKIPTAFWNKEDPSHFDRFGHRAPLFDYVFTSDSDMIPTYRAAVKHDRVFALPFAAQPKIHNPILETERAYNVCFAGAYYALDHDERRKDMDHLLRPSLAYDLHIYDRQHGAAAANANAFQFPEVYQPAIRGRLEYDKMVEAYKWYKVFLNVNSVKQSPTMFSRRVFELLACGTPVLSSYSKGIVALLGSDIVHISQSEAETRNHLERLLKDDDYWAKVALKGIREVLSKHTYAHRFAEICRNMGLNSPGLALPKIAAFALVDSVEDLARLTRNLARQTYRNFDLTVIARRDSIKSRADIIGSSLPGIEARMLPPGTPFPEPLGQAPAGSYVWLLNPNDFYGENFLNDAALATVYSDADVIGKLTRFELVAAVSKPRLCEPNHEFRFVNTASPGSIIAKAGKLGADQWKALAENRLIDLSNFKVLSIDRFNYVRCAEKAAHLQSDDALTLPASASV
jgi:spore maturation protein CgeB/SAM-dependent methyltransferase